MTEPTPRKAKSSITVADIVSDLAPTHAVMERIVVRAIAFLDADGAMLIRFERRDCADGGVLVRRGIAPHLFEVCPCRRQIFRDVERSGRVVCVPDARADRRFDRCVAVRKCGLVSMICLPIDFDNRTLGLLRLDSRNANHFRESDVGQIRPALAVAGSLLAKPRSRRVAGADVVTADRRSDATSAAVGVDETARFVGRSKPIARLREEVERAAATDFPVLVLGETGTGKNIIARMVHDASRRCAEPFVTVYCPCLGRDLVEGELFGHRKGAFTGALRDRRGKVRAAEGGTLFLDEIGDLPMEIQPKLLRLLQDRKYEPVGDSTERFADVRIVAATNHDLTRQVEAGLFRWDLYERLNFLRIEIPPLRDRREDIPDLLRHALVRYGAGKRASIAPSCLESLSRLDRRWPGNVRDIQHLAARIATLDLEGSLDFDELAPLLDVAPRVLASRKDEIDFESGLPALMSAYERNLIGEAMRRFPGLSRDELATKLRISRAALFKKLRRHDPDH